MEVQMLADLLQPAILHQNVTGHPTQRLLLSHLYNPLHQLGPNLGGLPVIANHQGVLSLISGEESLGFVFREQPSILFPHRLQNLFRLCSALDLLRHIIGALRGLIE
jgi:hypothetical protein